MHYIFVLLIILLSVSSATTTATSGSNSTNVTAPCSILSSSWAAQIAVSPSATPTVAASLAYDCLKSVPLHTQEAVDLVKSLRPYLEWQTNTAYLRDPPADYFFPPFDVFGKLDSIESNLGSGYYANEYEFQEDLFQITALSHDGHFFFYPELTNVFKWERQLRLISISSDGNEIPEIYAYPDVISSPETASVLTEINGIDAATYVADWAYTASINQDPDAAYNAMFYSPAFEGTGSGNGYFQTNGRGKYLYPGANTTFTFANGTVITLDNIAHVKGNFTNVNDGESLYYQFCTGIVSSSNTTSSTSPNLTVVPSYPDPILTTKDTIVSGYYLDGESFKDVAVLNILDFASKSPVEFQAVVHDFFTQAVAAKKSKLVIDLSANGGGYLWQAYDLFRQLFPDIVQQDYSRFRENGYFLTIAQIISNSIPSDYDPNTASDQLIEDYEVTFNWRYQYNLTEQPFPSFAAKFDPVSYKGDNFTPIIRYNLDDTLTTSNSTYGFGTNVTGYGNRTDFTQPFLAENIALLYDGFCGSTCAVFSEFMHLPGEVKHIAIGGRPNRDPMQAVGGNKGYTGVTFDHIHSYAQMAISQTNSSYQISLLKNLTKLPQNRSSSCGINLSDLILPGNLDGGLPAQFVFQEADFRIFYTLDMMLNVSAMWKAAADVAWNGASYVAGGGLERIAERERGMKRSGDFDAHAEFAGRTDLLERIERAIEVDPVWKSRFGTKIAV